MRKFLSSLLASTMILSTVGMISAQEVEQTTQPSEVLEQQETKTLASGTCGANATWSLANGVLTISGTGPMTQYSAQSTAPWYTYRNNMTTLVIADGITSIGDSAFYSCDALTDVHIPSSVHTIGQTAFHQCTSLTSIEIPKSVTTIDRHTFWVCDKLTDIYFEGTQAQWNAMKLTMSSEALVYGVPKIPVEVNATVHFNSTMSAPPANYPDWSTTFVDFIQPTIMPDITVENYNDPSNRGLIAQSLYNMSGNSANINPTHSFSDVGDFGTAIAWCHAAEIMSGTGETSFGTEGDVTREQFALILKQMATTLEKQTTQGDVSSLEGYADAWSISSWAQEGVAWAVANGLMAGADNALNPHGNVTRLEVAVMLSAFQNL